MTIWANRAERLLEDALSQLRSGIDDPLPTISAAETALLIETGERAPEEMSGYVFPGEDEDEEENCSCPPDLRARGGFTIACPAH